MKVPELPPDRLDEHGVPPAASACPVPSDARAGPWPSLAPHAVDHLAREFSGLKTSSVAELEKAIRARLAKTSVPREAHGVEVEKVVRRIAALADAADTVVNFCDHAGRAAPYVELGPAGLGGRCISCGSGIGAKKVRLHGKVEIWHPACAKKYLAGMAEPQVKLPDLGPDPLDEHGVPRAVPACPSTNSEPGLSRRRIQELADWYADEGYRRHREDRLGTDAELNADLRAILREEVFPEHVEIEFERVMRVVFGGI